MNTNRTRKQIMHTDTLASPLERIVVSEEANAQAMSGGCFKVLAAVARLINTDRESKDYGLAWGTHRQYAEFAGMDKSSIGKHLNNLEEDGWLICVRENPSTHHKVYRLGIGTTNKSRDKRKGNTKNFCPEDIIDLS